MRSILLDHFGIETTQCAINRGRRRTYGRRPRLWPPAAPLAAPRSERSICNTNPKTGTLGNYSSS